MELQRGFLSLSEHRKKQGKARAKVAALNDNESCLSLMRLGSSLLNDRIPLIRASGNISRNHLQISRLDSSKIAN